MNNSYTLKVLNPLILYKDYDFDENVGYFISIKPNDKEQMEVKQFLHTYDTDERNIGITATSGEGLTEVGKGNGISVFAVLTVDC